MTTRQKTAERALRRLTESEVEQYQRRGYLKNLPVFDASEIPTLQKFFEELASRLPDCFDINQVNMWPKCSRTFYNICRHPTILDWTRFFPVGRSVFCKVSGRWIRSALASGRPVLATFSATDSFSLASGL